MRRAGLAFLGIAFAIIPIIIGWLWAVAETTVHRIPSDPQSGIVAVFSDRPGVSIRVLVSVFPETQQLTLNLSGGSPGNEVASIPNGTRLAVLLTGGNRLIFEQSASDRLGADGAIVTTVPASAQFPGLTCGRNCRVGEDLQLVVLPPFGSKPWTSSGTSSDYSVEGKTIRPLAATSDDGTLLVRLPLIELPWGDAARALAHAFENDEWFEPQDAGSQVGLVLKPLYISQYSDLREPDERYNSDDAQSWTWYSSGRSLLTGTGGTIRFRDDTAQLGLQRSLLLAGVLLGVGTASIVALATAALGTGRATVRKAQSPPTSTRITTPWPPPLHRPTPPSNQ
jgi:hypothetical protein